MKTVYLYSPYLSSFGGGEKYLLGLARVLARLDNTAVVLLAPEDIAASQLEQFFGIDLSNVELRHIRESVYSVAQAASSADVFVCLSNFRPVKTSARVSVQLLQIPYAKITPLSMLGKFMRGNVKEAAKDLYRLQLLAYAKHEADAVITNSHFVHDTLLNNFGVQSIVLHPPIDDFHREAISKKNVILSVGRFFTGLYNQKRYDILTQAFRRLCTRLKGWEYHIVGSASQDKATSRMIEQLKSENQGFPVFLHVNASYDTLLQLYNEATIFWHAAGYDADETKHPENVEHFGMTTVEAMSAGCAPIVINKGGQKEIVQHGVNGFLWNSLEKLIDATIHVTQQPLAALHNLQHQARKRYQDFSIDRFKSRVKEIFSPLLT